MSIWQGDVEVGLAPGQTSGEVSGQYIQRDPSSDPSKVYIEASDIQTVRERGGRQRVTVAGRTFYADPNFRADIGYYNYPSEPGRSVGGNYPTEAEIEQQATLQSLPPGARRSPPFQLQPTQRQITPSLVPERRFQIGGTGAPQDTLTRTEGLTRKEYKAYPSTAIRKKEPKEDIEGYYTYPVYKAGAGISKGLQSGFEGLIGYTPESHPIKKVGTGFVGFFTGVPEWIGTGIVGAETVGRTVKKGKATELPSMFVKGAIGMGGEIVKQAKEKPYETIGMTAGMATLWKAGGVKKGGKVPEFKRQGFESFESWARQHEPKIKGGKVPEFKRQGFESFESWARQHEPKWKKPMVAIGLSSIQPKEKPDKPLLQKMFGTTQPEKTVLKVTKPEDIEVMGKWTPATAEKEALRYIIKKHPSKPKPQIWVSSKKSLRTPSKAPVLQKMFGEKTGKKIGKLGRIVGETIKTTPATIKKEIITMPRKMFGTRQPEPTVLKITKAEDISVVKKWTPVTAEKAALQWLIKKHPSKPKPQIWVSSKKSLRTPSKAPVLQKMFGEKTGKKIGKLGRIVGETIKTTPAAIKKEIITMPRKMFGKRDRRPVLKVTRPEDIEVMGKWTPATAEKAALRHIIKKHPSESKPQIWVSTPKKTPSPKTSIYRKMFGKGGYKKPRKPLVFPGLLYIPRSPEPSVKPRVRRAPKQELIYEVIERPKERQVPSPRSRVRVPRVRVPPSIIPHGKARHPTTISPRPDVSVRLRTPTAPTTTIKPRLEYTPDTSTHADVISLPKQSIKQREAIKTRARTSEMTMLKPRLQTKSALKLKSQELFKKPKGKKGKGAYKFGETTGVTLPAQMMGILKAKSKRGMGSKSIFGRSRIKKVKMKI